LPSPAFLDGALALVVATIAAFAYAVAVRPLLGIGGRAGAVLSVCVAFVVLFAPLCVPSGRIGLRAIVAVVSAELMFKMVDYARQARRVGRYPGTFPDYLRFLVPFPIMLVVYHASEQRPARRPSRPGEILRALAAAALVAMSVYATTFASTVPAVRKSFALDHAIKLVLFVVAIESLSRVMSAIERLAGYDTKPVIQNAYLARTVGEFWCRYNTRVHAWFVYNVFRPSGGVRAPVRGVFLVFFASAVFHELMFDIATSRADGYQFLFFMIQAPAVFISSRFEALTRGWGVVGKAACHIVTIAWFSATSILFFNGMNRVFPFVYANGSCLP
jgi:MBOAT, membrane-bound O-acyltransferase family